jgi:hypothetical protein
MRLYHFVLVFVIIAVSIIVFLDIKKNELNTVIDNREQIERNLDTAIDDAATKLVEVDVNNNLVINKEAAINSFFISLDSTFGILSDKESQEKLNLYVPVLIVTIEDGFYVFYSDEYRGADGSTYIAKRWSEKFPYYYEDEDFIYGFRFDDVVNIFDKNNLLGGGLQAVYTIDYHDFQTKDAFSSFRASRPNSIILNDESYELVRKGAIMKCLEDTMSYYTSRHNLIAGQYGITYNFSLPAANEEEWAPYLDRVSLYVVFQGYPYGNELGETYNRVASAGAKISKHDVFYIEQKGWYLVYHNSGCSELLKEGLIIQDEPYYEAIECIKQGCYACPVCIENGVYAPDYQAYYGGSK